MEESITYYDDHCERFVKETFEIDMSFVYQPFLELVPAGGRLLDAGCGSGRDALAFSRLGFEVDAFDASSRCVEQARTLTGLQIEQLRFDEMAFENESTRTPRRTGGTSPTSPSVNSMRGSVKRRVGFASKPGSPRI
jgi:SAM-dependent methyltransferase